jgi:hypothetical protein
MLCHLFESYLSGSVSHSQFCYSTLTPFCLALQDATDRCKEVIPLETAAASSSILEPESAAVCGTLESFWDMVPGARSGGRNSSSRLKDSGCTGQEEDGSRSRQGAGNFNILAAMFALLVALIGGVVFTFSAGSNT